ncbi:MAG TPA: flagellar hook capping FlgD N-terminal domain-containing protein [Eoetvoesiella sp.]
MATVNPSSSGADAISAGALAQASASAAERNAATKNQFMTLLVTQLQNQDPLNPMDNAAVTSQLAQLETVNGINQLNTTLMALSGQMDLSQSMQAANLIGKDVLVPGNKVSLGSTTIDGIKTPVATPFGVDLVSRAEKVVVTITGPDGNAVRQIEMGPQQAGVLTLEWDGKGDAEVALSDGKYTVQVAAMDAEGKPIAAEALTYGKVSSVAYSSSGLQLDLGLAGTHSLFDLRKIM